MSLPVLDRGLCPNCVESIRRQDEQYRKGNIYPGINQHTETKPYLGVNWYPTEWAIINTLKRAAPLGLNQTVLAQVVYGATRRDMRHAIRQRIYVIRGKLEGTPFRIRETGSGYVWEARGIEDEPGTDVALETLPE